MPGFLFCICSILVVIPGRAKREPGIHTNVSLSKTVATVVATTPGSMLRIAPEDA